MQLMNTECIDNNYSDSPQRGRFNMKRIDLENHFATEPWLEALRSNAGFPRIEPGKGLGYYDDTWLAMEEGGVGDKLLDLGHGRIGLMDQAGVDHAVLSLGTPGVEQFEPAVGTAVATACNDILAAAIDRHPDRFSGFAALAPKDVDAAIGELERCVQELGFVGWNTHSNFGDSYLDEKRYWPLLAKVEELGVPIYLHPIVPKIAELRSFGLSLAGPTFGFGTDVQFVYLRMILRGVFDAFPKLKIILGHYGESFPFLVNRVDAACRQPFLTPNPDIGPGSAHPPSYYLLNNMWVTTSGNFLSAAFFCTRDSLGIDKILLGTDYPYERMGAAPEFLEGLALTQAEYEQVYEENAVTLGITGRAVIQG
jgi:predicted TIM-barrel fold metal-dependent hydrolase